jgi:hypothetical protein
MAWQISNLFSYSPGIAYNAITLTFMLSCAQVRRNSLKSGCSSTVEHQLPNSRSHLTSSVTA